MTEEHVTVSIGPPEGGKILRVSVLGKNLVELTSHALKRMSDRGVTEAEVLQTLRAPDQTGLPTQPGRQRVRWNQTRIVYIDVVYEEAKDRIGVITVIKERRSIAESLSRRRRRK